MLNNFFHLYGCDDSGEDSSDNTKIRKKILCLHGGGQDVSKFKSMLSNLTNDLNDEFEFLFADSTKRKPKPNPIDAKVWYKDKPGGKESTEETDEKWADDSVIYLDNLIQNTGPVDYILAYSQGVPMSLILLSKRNYINASGEPSITKLILLNGYLPKTHKGLMNLIERNSKFSEKTLIFLGQEDSFYTLGLELKNHFKNYEEIQSKNTGHGPPDKNDDTYNEIVKFIKY